MNPILRIVFAVCVVVALLSFGLWRLTPDRSERAHVWAVGSSIAALAMLLLWVYWDVLT